MIPRPVKWIGIALIGIAVAIMVIALLTRNQAQEQEQPAPISLPQPAPLFPIVSSPAPGGSSAPSYVPPSPSTAPVTPPTQPATGANLTEDARVPTLSPTGGGAHEPITGPGGINPHPSPTGTFEQTTDPNTGLTLDVRTAA
jgi:hypothetical protein